MAYKGRFQCRNPGKYQGDHRDITYRSGLELRLMNYLDLQPGVLAWGSETVIIPYRSPIDGKMHRYFTDFYVKMRNTKGEIEELLIEVKPLKQCSPPKPQARKTRKFLTEVQTWGVNEAKWRAANSYCIARGWKFKIMTEKEIGGIA